MLGSMNLITTIIGFGMSATFIVFVCTRLICGRFRRIEARQMFEIDSRTDLELPEHRINGLEPVVVAAIPTMKFDHEAFSSMEDAQCTICLAEYQEKEMLRIMPKCGHSFHLVCIDTWLRKQSTCPVCRLSVQDSIDTKDIRSATLSAAHSFNSSEITLEHSQQWLLPPAAATESNQAREFPISIEVEANPSAPTASRPSS
ncbi:RING-H2 finger protein ATL66-like [Andrographis paniculata]|uniref:RING-H2 finger protein ATL66-like n=1 Tax=Andrographis paniculata TaxID=175694 RepID=UPI0021E78BEE|nr:RING-H2 finger protein ATL66-like [Andrographis paniculata]